MYILGFDIGGTKCAAVTGEWNGEEVTLLKKKVTETNHSLPVSEMIEKIFTMAEEILEKTPDSIGISCGGPLDSKKGIVMRPPNLPEWDNVEITRLASERFGAPARLQNDANACAVAEWKFGAGRGADNLIFLTFGTGLGAGLILNGKLYEGANGNAGELGHVRIDEDGPIGYGKYGSLEGFCSGGGIQQLGYKMANLATKNGLTPTFCLSGAAEGDISAKTIAEAARGGDKTAIEVYRTSGRYLGRGLAMLIDILNPERIVIGSIFKRARDLLWDEAEKELKKEALSISAECCKIVPAELGENIGDYAALATALL